MVHARIFIKEMEIRQDFVRSIVIRMVQSTPDVAHTGFFKKAYFSDLIMRIRINKTTTKTPRNDIS